MTFVFDTKTGPCQHAAAAQRKMELEMFTRKRLAELENRKPRVSFQLPVKADTPPPSPEKMDTTEEHSQICRGGILRKPSFEISQKAESLRQAKAKREAAQRRKRKFQEMKDTKLTPTKKKFMIVINPTKITMYASKYAKVGELTGFVYVKSDGCLIQEGSKWRKIASEVSVRGAVCPAMQLELMKAMMAKTSVKVLVTQGPAEEELPTFVLEKHVPLPV